MENRKMNDELTIKTLFDLSKTAAKEYLEQFMYPWDALGGIGDFLAEYCKTLDSDRYITPEESGLENVWIARSAKVAPSACICGITVIGENAEIRHGAYIRGNALIGDKSVVGNSCEIKNAILFESAQVPHFNYVGDSILGYKSHLGAGAVTSNIKSDRTNVSVIYRGVRIQTEKRKFGAAIGDYTEIGCNSVMCPGSVLGRGVTIYPLSRVRGFVPENCILKDNNTIVRKERKD